MALNRQAEQSVALGGFDLFASSGEVRLRGWMRGYDSQGSERFGNR